MSSTHLPPNDPREWINRAQSNLSQARGGIHLPQVYLEDLCFQAQQAAEKALKAVLIQQDIRFPYTHDLATLLSLLARMGRTIPDPVLAAARLSDYAVSARYPGFSEPVSREEYDEAVTIAEASCSGRKRYSTRSTPMYGNR
jgi:HEPN domain-containing protein